MNLKEYGHIGEESAKKYLQKLGHKIVDSNYYIWGGEIDIITLKDEVFHFVEVKTRLNEKWLELESTISKKKLAKLINTSTFWLVERNLTEVFWQIDFIGIILTLEKQVEKIEYIEDITGW